MLATNSTGKKNVQAKQKIQGLDNVYGISAGVLSGIAEVPEQGL